MPSAARVRRRVAACAFVATFVVLPGCGRSDYAYVKNTEAGTFLRMPAGWHAQPMPGPAKYGIDSREISPQAERELAGREWLIGIDGGTTFDETALVMPDAAEPKGFVQVRTLLPEEAAAMSTNDLRNLFVDVDRAQAAQAEATRADPFGARLAPAFQLLVDEREHQDGGVHGVHLVYQLATSQGLVTVDQTSLLDQDQTVLYQLVLACAAWCYDTRAADVDDVRTSFTVTPTTAGR